MTRSVVLSLTLWIFCCQSGDRALTEGDKEAVVKEVTQFFENYFLAVKKNGLTAEFDYLDHSPDFFWVPPTYKVPISYDSVAEVLTLNAPRYISVQNSFDSLRVIPLTKGLATYTATLRSIMEDTAGNVSTLQLIETGIVIKRKDRWKLLNGQTSLIE